MAIEVRLFATLRRYRPELGIGEPLRIEIAEKTTVRDVLRQLGIPEEDVKIVMRNNRQVELDTVLEDGDRVAFIPAVGGG